MAATPALRVLGPLLVVAACVALATTFAAPDGVVTAGTAPAGEPPARSEGDPSAGFVRRFQEGQRMLGTGDDAAAERVFRELLVERPGEPAVHHALATVLRCRGRLEDAGTSFVEAARLAPEDPVIQRDAGVHLLSLGRHAEAERLLARARELWPADVEASTAHGLALRSLGRLEDAVAAYRQAFRADPDSVDARVGLAACILRTAPEEAVRLLAPVSAPWPDASLVRGLAQLELRRWAEAGPSLRAAADQAAPRPDRLAYLPEAAEGLVRCGDAEGAERAAEQWCAADRVEDRPRLRAAFCLALAKSARGDAAGARAALGSAAPSDAAAPALRDHLDLFRAIVEIRGGDWDAALPHLERLADSDADGFERLAARRLLERATLEELAAAAETDPARGNDAAFVEMLVAQRGGHVEAAERYRKLVEERSDPPGEYPGLLVR